MDYYGFTTNGEMKLIEVNGYKNSNVYNGGNIRLISCETGADGATAAQSLAEQLNVTVMAPSNTVWVMPDGAMSIGDTPSINNGEWRIFKPKRK